MNLNNSSRASISHLLGQQYDLTNSASTRRIREQQEMAVASAALNSVLPSSSLTTNTTGQNLPSIDYSSISDKLFAAAYRDENSASSASTLQQAILGTKISPISAQLNNNSIKNMMMPNIPDSVTAAARSRIDLLADHQYWGQQFKPSSSSASKELCDLEVAAKATATATATASVSPDPATALIQRSAIANAATTRSLVAAHQLQHLQPRLISHSIFSLPPAATQNAFTLPNIAAENSCTTTFPQRLSSSSAVLQAAITPAAVASKTMLPGDKNTPINSALIKTLLSGSIRIPSEEELKQDHNRKAVFPEILHQMLLDLEQVPGGMDIASFLPNGYAFVIHKPNEFVEHVMPQYFRMTRFASFQRQLLLYNFQRVDTGKKIGSVGGLNMSSSLKREVAYYHKYFIRSSPLLSTKIKRISSSTTTAKKKSLNDNHAT